MIILLLKRIIKLTLLALISTYFIIYYLQVGADNPVITELKALQHNDLLRAYDQHAQAFKDKVSLLNYSTHVSVLNNNSDMSILEKNLFIKTGVIKAKVHTTFGDVIVLYQLIREKNAWKILSYQYN